MKVLQLCHDYAGPFVSVCEQFASGLADHDVTTAFVKGAPRDDIVERIPGRVLFLEQDESQRGIKFASLLEVAKLFREQSYDLVIAHRYKAIYLAGVMSYFFDVPNILAMAHEHKVFRRPTRRLFVTFWRPRILLGAVSASVASDIGNDCASAARGKHIFVIPNVIHPEVEPEFLSQEDARAALGLATAKETGEESGKVFGTIGRLIDKKRHDVLIRGFAESQLKDATLVLMGDGPKRAELESLTKELGVAERVHFAGHVENARRYVRALDAFVFSSGAEEAFGIVLLEAMLAGVPVISSDVAGPKEVLGEFADYFPDGDTSGLANLFNQFQMTEEKSIQCRDARQRVLDQFTDVRPHLAAIPQLSDLFK